MRTATISVIPRKFSDKERFETNLSMSGMSRMPGTGVTIFPARHADGRYKNGLDPDAPEILKIEDPKERERKRAEVLALRTKLEEKTQLDLKPNSSYYDFSKSTSSRGVQAYKLRDQDNIFSLDDAIQYVTFLWVSQHPAVAESLEAYKAGLVRSSVQFYVKNQEAEAEIVYKEKREYNDAFAKFTSFGLEKRKKIGRLLGLPLYDDTREEIVYNMVDDFLKATKVGSGPYINQRPVAVFNIYAGQDDNSLYVKDLVEQAFKNQIYREGKGKKVYEGQEIVFQSKDEAYDFFLEEKNQADLLALEKKLKTKKLASV